MYEYPTELLGLTPVAGSLESYHEELHGLSAIQTTQVIVICCAPARVFGTRHQMRHTRSSKGYLSFHITKSSSTSHYVRPPKVLYIDMMTQRSPRLQERLCSAPQKRELEKGCDWTCEEIYASPSLGSTQLLLSSHSAI